MAGAFEMIKRMQAVDIKAMVSAVASEHTQLFAVYNQFQLASGKDRTGAYLPRYVDDPYFENIQAALAYQNWKEKISISKDKPVDVMDFRIRGDFHNSIRAEVKGMEVNLYSNSAIAADVMAKTGGKALGINPDSARELWEDVFRPALLLGIAMLTGIKSSTASYDS